MKKVISAVILALVMLSSFTSTTAEQRSTVTGSYLRALSNQSTKTSESSITSVGDVETTSSAPAVNPHVGDSILFGLYEQDGNTSNGKEPIEWTILKIEDTGICLISTQGLECMQFNSSGKEVTWETCELRAWLNEDFLNEAFTQEEAEKILTTTVKNDKAQGSRQYKTAGSNDTSDKVFILSYNEATTLFSSDNDRKCIPTEYAVAQGALSDTSGKTCTWWLRSPGDSYSKAMCVWPNGSFTSFYVQHLPSSIRPVIWISPDASYSGFKLSSDSNTPASQSDGAETESSKDAVESSDSESATAATSAPIQESKSASTIKIDQLGEAKLYDLYSQVQSQLLLNRFESTTVYQEVTDYEDIERNPTKHTGEELYFKGKIIQVVEGSGITTYRINMNSKSSQTFLVTYTLPDNSERFLEDDEVCVYATFIDLETYTSTTNLSVSVPYVSADLIIHPVKNESVASATNDDLSETLTLIRERLNKVVSKQNDYVKITKTNYTDYARHEALHSEEKVFASGKVLQVLEGSTYSTIRLAVDSDSDSILYLICEPAQISIRILEDDKITITGEYSGLYTYSSIRSGDITIPSVITDSIKINGYTAPSSFPKDADGNYKLTKNVYEDYARRPETHTGEKISFSAKVLQVIEGDSVSTYRMSINSDSDYVIYVTLPNSSRTMRILEDDQVTVIATFNGLYTYTSTLGASITIPQCTASSVVVPGKATTTAKKDDNGNYKVTKSNYESFARDEQTYLNQSIAFTAEVVQVVDGTSSTTLRLAVDGSYDAMFLAVIDNTDISVRILEDDTITIEGTSKGLYSYNSTLGGKITVPSCQITSYSIKGYKKINMGSPDAAGYYKITADNYEEIARNPKPYVGSNISFKAKVVQVVEGKNGANIYRVAVNSNNNCMFYVQYNLPTGASRILENDIVTLKGEYYGIYSYKTTLGSTVSVPALLATDISK